MCLQGCGLVRSAAPLAFITDRVARPNKAFEWTAGCFETRCQLDTYRPLRIARRTNPHGCTMASVGKAEVGSAGEQPAKEYPARDSSWTMGRARRQRRALYVGSGPNNGRPQSAASL